MSSGIKRKDDIINKPNDMFLTMAPHLSPINPNGKNFAFSPVSLRALLSLIAVGASGPTLQQLLSFLNSDSIDDVNKISSEIVSSVLANGGGPKISFANATWIQEGLSFKHSFKQVADNVYKASSHQVDFINTEAEKIISEVNSWGEKNTNGLIKDILPPGSIRNSTRLILANALYFKGKWLAEYFEESETKEYEFHLLGGGSVKVPFMTSDWWHYIGTYDGFKSLRLHYKQEKYDEPNFSMYILLPDDKDGLPALVEKVVSEHGFLDRHLPRSKFPVNEFRLPRFKISFGFKASETLKKVGVSLPFEAGGLTETVDSVEMGRRLKVSEIHHKCFIEVNEEGTEAAAVSEADDDMCLYESDSESPPSVDFVADHPFMFVIREDTSGAVLFFGHVLNPLEESK